MNQPREAGNPQPPDSLEYLGIYQTPGGHNTLELKLDSDGSLGGYFSLGGETLEVRSIPGPAGRLHGMLMDNQAEAVTVFRACLVPGGITLELDIPAPQADFSEAETLHFIRVKAPLLENEPDIHKETKS